LNHLLHLPQVIQRILLIFKLLGLTYVDGLINRGYQHGSELSDTSRQEILLEPKLSWLMETMFKKKKKVV
jgi:hypothetical protein